MFGVAITSIMLSVVILNVIRLNVLAPCRKNLSSELKKRKETFGGNATVVKTIEAVEVLSRNAGKPRLKSKKFETTWMTSFDQSHEPIF